MLDPVTAITDSIVPYSGFSDVDAADDPTGYIRRLDNTGSLPLWQIIKGRMLAVLDVQESDWVLDIGSGTGSDTLAFGPLVGETGRVVGIDRSQTMVLEARTRAAGRRLPVEHCQASAQALPFANQTFDACRCERVLQHLEQPSLALVEMVRVARSGCRIAVAEPDYGGLAIRGASAPLSRRLVELRRAHFRNGTIGRDIARILNDLGIVDCTVTVLTDAQTELPDWYLDNLRRAYIIPAVSIGAISSEEGSRWLAELKEAAAVGRFRHATPIFLVTGRKP